MGSSFQTAAAEPEPAGARSSGFGVRAVGQRFCFRQCVNGGQLGGLLGPLSGLRSEVADDDHDGADEVNGGEDREVDEVDQELQEKTGSQLLLWSRMEEDFRRGQKKNSERRETRSSVCDLDSLVGSALISLSLLTQHF